MGLPAFVWVLRGGCRQCTSASAVVHCAHGLSSHDTVTRRHGHGGGTAERAERTPTNQTRSARSSPSDGAVDAFSAVLGGLDLSRD